MSEENKTVEPAEQNVQATTEVKEEVKEVSTGYECGVMLENYSDIKVNDIIETFEIIKTDRKL